MYVYQAETYCDACGERVREDLTREGFAPADPADEYSYDSDEFPKGSLPSEATDSPDHCASGSECLQGIDLGEYGLAPDAPLYGAEVRTIGAVTNDGLTDHGVSWLRETLAETRLTPYQRALHTLWRETYREELA
jgi:hypothetical protein